MNTSHRSARRVVRHLATPARLAVAALAVGGATFAFAPSASAGEFYANPTLSVINECNGGVYHYHVGLYNFAATDATTFTVTVSGTNQTNGTTTYPIAAGGLLWLDYTVPEATTGSFHVVNTDVDHPIDFLATPKPDCIADTQTNLSLVCGADGTATVVYDWVNTSYAPAHFGLSRDSALFLEGDYVWIDHQQSLQASALEGEHVLASIIVDGMTSSSIDQVVDCIADTTIPDTTIPDTTIPATTIPATTIPATTVPDTTPATTPETTPETIPATVPEISTVIVPFVPAEPDPSTTQPATTQPVSNQPASTVQQLAIPQDITLPVTGSSDSSGAAKFGLAALLGGLGLVRLARRTR